MSTRAVEVVDSISGHDILENILLQPDVRIVRKDSSSMETARGSATVLALRSSRMVLIPDWAKQACGRVIGHPASNT